MKKRKILTMIALGIIGIITLSTTVHAAYQSVGRGTAQMDSATNGVINIRKMESIGGGMGLQETINNNTGLATSDPNNIDVHMLKNTEYGAILLLGASDYGKQGTSIESRRMDQGATSNATQPMATTTGNKYGIFEIGYYDMYIGNNGVFESVAGGASNFLTNIAKRYVNRYTTSKSSALPGDATTETENWHGANSSIWVDSIHPALKRGYYSAFEYSYGYEVENNYTRAAVVVGKGF